MSRAGRAPWPVALRLTVAVWLVYVVTAGGSLATGDAVSMFEQVKAIVDRADLDVPASQSSEEWRGRDGRYYAPFGIGQSLYDIPWLLAGRAVNLTIGAGQGDRDRLPKALVALGNTVPAAGAVGAGFPLAWLLSGSVRGSFVAAGALAFCTPLWPYSKYGFNAPLAAVTLGLGLFGVARGAIERSSGLLLFGGAALGAALLTRHVLMLAALVALAWMGVTLARTPEAARLLTSGATGIIAAIALWGTLNWVRFGNPIWTGHSPGFSLAGLLGLTLSPAGSLFLYSPVAVAGIGLVPLAREAIPVQGCSSPSQSCSAPSTRHSRTGSAPDRTARGIWCRCCQCSSLRSPSGGWAAGASSNPRSSRAASPAAPPRFHQWRSTSREPALRPVSRRRRYGLSPGAGRRSR